MKGLDDMAQSLPDPVIGEDISCTSDGQYRGRVRVGRAWLRTEKYATVEEAAVAWRSLKLGGHADFATRKAAKQQGRTQHSQPRSRVYNTPQAHAEQHPIAAGNLHSSQDTMQPEVRTTVPGNRGAHAIACGIPAGNIESRQHGFMQYTRDCHARPAGPMTSFHGPPTAANVLCDAVNGWYPPQEQDIGGYDKWTWSQQQRPTGSGAKLFGNGLHDRPSGVDCRTGDPLHNTGGMNVSRVTQPHSNTCPVRTQQPCQSREPGYYQNVSIQHAGTRTEQVGPYTTAALAPTSFQQSGDPGFVSAACAIRAHQPFLAPSVSFIPFVPSERPPQPDGFQGVHMGHPGIFDKPPPHQHHPSPAAPQAPTAVEMQVNDSHLHSAAAAVPSRQYPTHVTGRHSADKSAQLPGKFVGHKVYLQEVYDQRLQDSGCTELELSRPLGAGTFGSVQLGWALLTRGTAARRQLNSHTSPASHLQMGASSSTDLQLDTKPVLLAAVKVYSNESNDFKREKHALKLLLGKPHIIQLLGVGYVSSCDSYAPTSEYYRRFPCLVLQLASGTLEDVNQPCSEHKARKWIKQLLEGLASLHAGGFGNSSEQIIHRDLKPLNLLLDEQDNLLIADFSCCAFGVTTSASLVPLGATGGADVDIGPPMGTFVGSEMYMAPEVGHYRLGKCYDRSVDSHSVGVIALGLLLGGRRALASRCKPVPNSASGQSVSISQFLLEIILGFEQPQLQLSSEFRDFVGACCTPGCRLMPEQLLSHSWLTDRFIANACQA